MGHFKESLCFVQFLHPGGEHSSDDGKNKAWNKGNHRRKFVKNGGKYVSGIQGARCNDTDTLGFWCEWEPDSLVEPVFNQITDGPAYIHTPYFSTPNSFRNLQNTDPFIFGDRFKYTICQQNRKTGPTQLRNLSRGSVILFGSHIKGGFVLDTLFVVDHQIDHCITNYERKIKGKVSGIYMKTTLNPLYKSNRVNRSCAQANQKTSYNLYFGATYENKVDGMFSFFPAQIFYENPQGFARPVIQIPDVITDNLRQGYKLNRGQNSEQVKELWNCVVKQVIGSKNGKLKLGTRSDLPPSAHKLVRPK